MEKRGKTRCRWIYNIRDEKKRNNGTEFLIEEKLRNKVIKFQPANGRISYIRIKNNHAKILIINLNAPTENSDDDKQGILWRTGEGLRYNIKTWHNHNCKWPECQNRKKGPYRDVSG